MSIDFWMSGMLEWVRRKHFPGGKLMMQNQKTWFRFALVFLPISILPMICASWANAQTWDWSPPAPHHAAVCRVSCDGGSGSGIYIEYGKLRGVLTAAHITEGQVAQVTFSDGTKTTGESTIDKFGHDIAFVFVTHSTLSPIPMAATDPQLGERVEFVTVGGPNHQLRRFWAIVKTIGSNTTEYNCDVLSGDSGGGILNMQKKLVGIQVHGYGENILTAWNGGAYRGAGSVSCRRIRDFLGRVAKCGPKGRPKPDGNAQFYPPANRQGYRWQPPAPLAPVAKGPAGRATKPLMPKANPVELPSTPPGLSIDYDKLVKEILAKINPEDFRGPAGPQGPIGGHGPMGPAALPAAIDLDDLVKQIKKRISGSIRVKVRPIAPK